MDNELADGPTWRIAKRCETGACVEVGIQDGSVLARCSAYPDGIHITLSKDQWRVFVAGVKDGDFDGI